MRPDTLRAPMPKQERLAEILAALEEAEETLASALDQRARATRELHTLRDTEPDEFFRAPRDAERVERLKQRVREFPAASVAHVYREIAGACETLTAPTTIAYFGSAGGFAHQAARERFGRSATYTAFEDVPTLLDAVTRGGASAGVLPLETSSDGAITATLHGLAASDAHICGEATVPSSFHLMNRTGNTADVDKIYGQRVALAACERFVLRELPRATLIDVPSGDLAAELAAEDHGAAVIGTQLLVELHDLRLAKERIEDHADIETRYAVVGSELPARTGVDRTVIAMAVHDAPGALYGALRPFADREINLTRLESRPARGAPWRYLFFVEMDGHVTDRPVLTALEQLRSISRHVRVLGSYPRPPTTRESLLPPSD